jgi:hypothetical protein
MVIAKPALVTPQALPDMVASLVERTVGVAGRTVTLHHDALTHMYGDINPEGRSLAGKGYLGILRAVEIFPNDRRQVLLDVTTPRIADVKLFTFDGKLHSKTVLGNLRSRTSRTNPIAREATGAHHNSAQKESQPLPPHAGRFVLVHCNSTGSLS